MSEFTEGPSDYLTIQFLEWLSERPRTYGDAMDAWRTSCPRFSIWEDALSAGLIRLGHGSFRERLVTITELAESLLRSRHPAGRRRNSFSASPPTWRSDRGDDQRRTWSPATRRGAYRPTSPSCRSCCVDPTGTPCNRICHQLGTALPTTAKCRRALGH